MSSKSSRRHKADDFTCIHCGQRVDARAFGTRHRNHCPYCLWSRHVDETPGDRRCSCRSKMEPIGIETKPDGEWSIIHRCTGCGVIKVNRIAGDDRELALLQLVLRPLSNPPFPLDRLPV
ncbi:MAG: RNHCP domain-containing protein [Planctomycetota bacterium]